MSKPLSIAPVVLKRLKGLPKDDKVECLTALCELPEVFGRPHVHSGIGIRKLGGQLFEFRGSLTLRFIFQDRPEDLFVSFLGNLDDVQTLLRRGRDR